MFNSITMNPVRELVDSLVNEHGRTPESLLPILQGVVRHERYVSDLAMMEIARSLDIPAAHVYGTATFYSFIPSRPVGQYVIRVCRTITCMMHGKNQIIKEIENVLKIRCGETTQDGLFTLLETNCLGQCHKGPAMLVNDVPYTNLTPGLVREILLQYVNGNAVNLKS